MKWPWLGSSTERSQDEFPAPSARSLELAGRARLTRQLAERALFPADPLDHEGAAGVACELYRQSVYWALAAHRASAATASAPTTTPLAESPEAATGDELEQSWDATDPTLLLRAAGESERLTRIRAELIGKSHVAYAELSGSQQKALAADLEAFSRALLEPLDGVQDRIEARWVARTLRIVGILAVLGVLWIAGSALRTWWEVRSDLAPHASWTASSRYPEGGCTSPEQRCTGSPNFFFCTAQEDNPWILFDLGEERTLSGVWVENRLESSWDRAIPLVVEVSTDNRRFKEVARRASHFTTWRQKFPRVRARWVKLRVPRVTFLHLATVRLLP